MLSILLITFLFVPKIAFAVPEFTELYINVTEAPGKGESQCSNSLIKHGSQGQIKVTAVLKVPHGEERDYDLTRVSLIQPGAAFALCTASATSCVPRTETGSLCNCMRMETESTVKTYYMNYEVTAFHALSGEAVQAVLGVKDFGGNTKPIISEIEATMPIIYMSVISECVFPFADTEETPAEQMKSRVKSKTWGHFRFKRGRAEEPVKKTEGPVNELTKEVHCCARNLIAPFIVKVTVGEETLLSDSAECVSFKDEYRPGETKEYTISYREFGSPTESCARSKMDEVVKRTSEHSGGRAPTLPLGACAVVMASCVLVAWM